MNLSAGLHITPKGVEEVKSRVYKLSIRKRSVLILLDNPQTIEYVLQKSVFHKDEILEEINNLVRDGFVALTDGVPQPVAATASSRAEGGAGGVNFLLEDGVVLSEAKFLLVDFCVDSFGTQSQSFIDEIGECRSVKNLGLCLRKLHEATQKRCPERLPVLLRLIGEINATA